MPWYREIDVGEVGCSEGDMKAKAKVMAPCSCSVWGENLMDAEREGLKVLCA